MNAFSYVMVLVSIILGLGITHLLSSFSEVIHRVRGVGKPIRVEGVYLIWVSYSILYLVSFWWWEFKYQQIEIEWSFGLYLFIIAYAISLFMMAAILVPTSLEEVNDTFEYFIEGRRWFFGMGLWVIAIDVVDTLLKGYQADHLFLTFGSTGTIAVAMVFGLVSGKKSVQIVVAVVAFLAQLAYMFFEMGILGSW